MMIKDIWQYSDEYIVVEVLEVANDIEIDFVCIQEKTLTFKAHPIKRILNGRNEKAVLDYITSTEPLATTLQAERVFDSPIMVNVCGDVLSAAEVLECISKLSE